MEFQDADDEHLHQKRNRSEGKSLRRGIHQIDMLDFESCPLRQLPNRFGRIHPVKRGEDVLLFPLFKMFREAVLDALRET